MGSIAQGRKRSHVEISKGRGRGTGIRSQCSFCGATAATDDHSRISGCKKVRQWGSLLKAEAAQSFVNQITGQGTLYPIQPLPDSAQPIMQDLPTRQMKWLVLHGRCLIDPQQTISLSNLCIIVTVLGQFGVAVNENYNQRAVMASLVVGWIQRTNSPQAIIAPSLEQPLISPSFPLKTVTI